MEVFWAKKQQNKVLGIWAEMSGRGKLINRRSNSNRAVGEKENGEKRELRRGQLNQRLGFLAVKGNVLLSTAARIKDAASFSTRCQVIVALGRSLSIFPHRHTRLTNP